MIFQTLSSISKGFDKLCPPNTKRGNLFYKIRTGLLIRNRIGNRALIRKSKEELFKNKQSKAQDHEKSPVLKLEDDFVFGLDVDLNLISTGSKQSIKFSGWGFHKKYNTKKIFLNLGGKEKKVPNINLPRWDVYQSQNHPNSINSGFWTIITLTENKDTKLELRFILENNKEFKRTIGIIKKK